VTSDKVLEALLRQRRQQRSSSGAIDQMADSVAGVRHLLAVVSGTVTSFFAGCVVSLPRAAISSTGRASITTPLWLLILPRSGSCSPHDRHLLAPAHEADARTRARARRMYPTRRGVGLTRKGL
jgi:hypothetical protein